MNEHEITAIENRDKVVDVSKDCIIAAFQEENKKQSDKITELKMDRKHTKKRLDSAEAALQFYREEYNYCNTVTKTDTGTLIEWPIYIDSGQRARAHFNKYGEV